MHPSFLVCEVKLMGSRICMCSVKDMMVPQGPPARSSREERKEKEASKHVQPPGTLSAEEIRARMPMEQEME